VYNAIRTNPDLWPNTALLIVYDEHGGIFDHVPPPACAPDGYVASAETTETGAPFVFDRLGVRVPAILVSPWIPRGTVVPGAEDPVNGRIFEHASIPATATEFFLNGDAKRTPREEKASTFLHLLTDTMRADDDCVVFGNLD
jgi:phospholipase C